MLKTKYIQSNKIEVGVDEVGRGCCAGPVVSAAVVLPENFYHPKLKDSKKMTEKARNEVSDYILEHAIRYTIASVQAPVIDKLNILNASILSMHECITQLQMNDIDLILVDGNQFKPYRTVDHVCIIKGDGIYASIAAASVVAKVYRDNLMKELDAKYPGYNWAKNKGYVTKDHLQAIVELGYCDQHRMSYSLQLPTKDAVTKLF